MCFSLSEKVLFKNSLVLFSIHKNRTSSSVRANHIRKWAQCSTCRDVIHSSILNFYDWNISFYKTFHDQENLKGLKYQQIFFKKSSKHIF